MDDVFEFSGSFEYSPGRYGYNTLYFKTPRGKFDFLTWLAMMENRNYSAYGPHLTAFIEDEIQTIWLEILSLLSDVYVSPFITEDMDDQTFDLAKDKIDLKFITREKLIDNKFGQCYVSRFVNYIPDDRFLHVRVKLKGRG